MCTVCLLPVVLGKQKKTEQTELMGEDEKDDKVQAGENRQHNQKVVLSVE